jgi:predicted dehydrogenase
MLRCIQVGVGGFGNRWLDAIAATPSIQHAALVDVSEDALQRALEKTGLEPELAFRECSQAFRRIDADFALIVVPPFHHEEVAEAAFDQGLHVLTEKPMAHEMDSAKRMVSRARKRNLTLMVSQNYRFREWIRSAKIFLESGELGGVSHAYVSFRLNPDWGPFRQKMDDVLLIEMSIHHFDMMRYLLGRDPTTVFARTWNPSWSWFRGDCAAAINLEMEGLPVLYEGSSVAFGSHTGWNGEWRIEGEEGSLDYEESTGLRRTHLNRGQGQVEIRPMPAENQEYSLLEFEGSLDGCRAPETNGLDNLKSLAMVFAAIRSKSEGRVVDVSEILG